MRKLLKVCVLGILVFGLSACDEVADNAGKAIDSATTEDKKVARALSIESPLLAIDYDKNYDPYFVIQSQDNNTIIEDIILNRGNCGVVKYKEDYDMANAYRELNGDKLKTKNGQFVDMKRVIWSNETNYYDSLDDDSKTIYKKIFPVKLSYGKKFAIPYQLSNLYGQKIGCNTNSIIEIEVIVNGGGSYIFKPKE
ncbi:hypothetical protein [Helicobacter sp. 23-1046]